jgi:hypothetical protein
MVLFLAMTEPEIALLCVASIATESLAFQIQKFWICKDGLADARSPMTCADRMEGRAGAAGCCCRELPQSTCCGCPMGVQA